VAKAEVRLSAVEVAFVLGLTVLLVRVGQVQLVRGAEFAAAADSQRTETVELPARRGSLFDRTGVPLAATLESYQVGIAPNELRDPPREVRLIAAQLGLSERQIRTRLSDRWIEFRGPFSSAQVYPLRAVRGVHLTASFARFYPDPDLARQLLGRPAGDGSPAGGIERVLDSLLTGHAGHGVVIRDGKGRAYESPSRLSAFPVPGHDVHLTIDAGVQEIVENALAEAIDRFDAAGGDVVVIDPRTGEVLAVSSRRADGSTPSSAFTSAFEPGSTAKIFAAAALLARNRVEPDDSVFGEGGRWVTPSRTLEDEHESETPWMTLEQAIRISSNIAAVKFAALLDPAEQFMMLRAFGFGTATGIEYPAESRGTLRLPYQWSGTTPQALAIGYEIAVTPLQLALAYGAIANDGVLMRPALIKRIIAPGRDVIVEHVPEPVRRVVPIEIARELREMLRGVTSAGGTGATAALSTFEVAGKTGTARVAGPGGYVAGSHIAVFASIFPAGDPQLVMVVKLDNPRGTYARVSAAPLTRAVLEQVLAAQTNALDRTRMTRNAAPVPRRAPSTGADMPRAVIDLPDTARPARLTRAVPDVLGLAPREAVRRLHAAGFRVRLEGSGPIVDAVPAAGDTATTGAIVVLRGTHRRGL